jgi:hypothetical protein
MPSMRPGVLGCSIHAGDQHQPRDDAGLGLLEFWGNGRLRALAVLD